MFSIEFHLGTTVPVVAEVLILLVCIGKSYLFHLLTTKSFAHSKPSSLLYYRKNFDYLWFISLRLFMCYCLQLSMSGKIIYFSNRFTYSFLFEQFVCQPLTLVRYWQYCNSYRYITLNLKQYHSGVVSWHYPDGLVTYRLLVDRHSKKSSLRRTTGRIAFSPNIFISNDWSFF